MLKSIKNLFKRNIINVNIDSLIEELNIKNNSKPDVLAGEIKKELLKMTSNISSSKRSVINFNVETMVRKVNF